MSKKMTMPAFFAVVFVWFTTHFGGGFASGIQISTFYVKYGWYSIFTPIISTLIQAFVFYFAWKYAVQHKTYDYRSWANGIFKPAEKILANLYEVIFNLILVTATAVAFATGGATLQTVLGTPYILNTIIIALLIFVLTIFGADVVRKAASILAIAIIIGILIIYIPNIIYYWPKIVQNISGMQSGTVPCQYDFWDALLQCFVYAGFQVCCVGAYIAHSSVLKDIKEVKKTAIYGFIINASILLLATLGIMIYYQEGILKEAVPALFVIKHGVGSSWMLPLVSILIILGVITTGVNLIYGITNRIVTWLGRNDSEEAVKADEKKRNILIAGGYVIFTWCIALFGLIPLVSKGYGTMGYVAIFTIIIPILIKGFKGWEKKTN